MAQSMRVRFAPSPTGALHIGGARTAMYNWLLARQSGGAFVLRIADTYRERSTPENEEEIQRLVGEGHAYLDEGAVRLRVPDEGATTVQDVIRGEVVFEHAAIDDFVIARSDGSPLYNLAVAVDDRDMGITHVIRGADHISNTPRQLLILAALGAEPPVYAHLPLLHGPDGKKLSKRHGAASVQEMRDAGYLPEAVRNYLALLGWGDEDDETLLSTDELIRRFDVTRVSRNPAQFDEQKLRWMNGRYIRMLPVDELAELLRPYARHDGDLEPAAAAAQAEVDPWTVDEIDAALRRVLDEKAVKPKQLFQPLRVATVGTTVSPG